MQQASLHALTLALAGAAALVPGLDWAAALCIIATAIACTHSRARTVCFRGLCFGGAVPPEKLRLLSQDAAGRSCSKAHSRWALVLGFPGGTETGSARKRSPSLCLGTVVVPAAGPCLARRPAAVLQVVGRRRTTGGCIGAGMILEQGVGAGQKLSQSVVLASNLRQAWSPAARQAQTRSTHSCCLHLQNPLCTGQHSL